MKTKINDMKLLHGTNIKKQRKINAQESNKQSDNSKNSKKSPKTKPDKEKNKELTEEEKKIIHQRKFLKKYRKLRKAKIVYDSLEDDESMDEKENKYLIFAEKSNILFVFDSVMLTSSVFHFIHLTINFAKRKTLY